MVMYQGLMSRDSGARRSSVARTKKEVVPQADAGIEYVRIQLVNIPRAAALLDALAQDAPGPK